MDEAMKADMDRFLKVSEKLMGVLENHNSPVQAQIGSSTTHINAGGLGVLITSVCAAFMLGLCMSMYLQLQHQQKQIDDLHDYLNVVYQYAPQLKPKDFK